MKDLLKNYIVDAVLLIVLGAIFLFRPGSSLVFLCHVVGIVLLVMGGVKLAGQFIGSEPKADEEGRTWTILVSVIQLVFGILLLVKTDLFIGIFPFLAGAVIAYGAVVSLVRTLKGRKTKTYSASIALSIITLILAIVVIMHPVMISDFIVQLIGVALLVEGVTVLTALSVK